MGNICVGLKDQEMQGMPSILTGKGKPPLAGRSTQKGRIRRSGALFFNG
jgi:hypothetical protein